MPISELEAMQEAGMTSMQVIVSATKTAAEICGLGQFLGTIEVGKLADFLVVRGDPLGNLRALLDVAWVIRGGTVIRQPGIAQSRSPSPLLDASRRGPRDTQTR